MPTELPCPVLINEGSVLLGRRARFGILVEWRQVNDRRGVGMWQGLVVFAYPAVSETGSWEVRMMWMPSCDLTQIATPRT